MACGGVLTALPALLESGLFRHAAPGLPKGYYGAATMLLFLCFLFLARLRAPELLRFEAPGEWGALLGLDRCPEVKTLRRKLRAFSADEQAVRTWQAALARDWAARDPELAASLCVDGHVKVYAGRKGHLPKHFVSRQKLCLPAATSYWIHALDGAPFLCLHQEVDPGMVRILRETILPELREMGVLPAEADPAAPALTLVFDREGWSPALFRHLASCGIACITWRKGRKQPDWPADAFSQHAVPLHGPGGMREAPALLAERTVTLPNGLTVREIRTADRERPSGAGDHYPSRHVDGGHRRRHVLALVPGELVQVHANRIRSRRNARTRARRRRRRHPGSQSRPPRPRQGSGPPARKGDGVAQPAVQGWQAAHNRRPACATRRG